MARYAHGQITESLPGSTRRLPPHYALQHPSDWLDSAARATRAALRQSKCHADDVIGIGVDFTSCTMLPARRDGTPLCLVEQLAAQPLAWPKLWKHHGARTQADRINVVARERGEPLLERYGGTIGLEWFFPKVLETLEGAPRVYDATDVWLEAGDWFVWQLVGGAADELPRSQCQAGYKGMWSATDGFPSADFLGAVHPKLADVVESKMPGRLLPPGVAAGGLTGAMARRLGLREGTPVSAAIIDAHAGVPGAGAAEPGTLVMVMGTSSCHMLNSDVERRVPGVAGVVKDGILPGYFGYETGQAASATPSTGCAGSPAIAICRGSAAKPAKCRRARTACAASTGSTAAARRSWIATLGGVFAGLALHHRPGASVPRAARGVGVRRALDCRDAS